MSRFGKALASGPRLLIAALFLAAPAAAAHGQQPKLDELAAKAQAILTKSCFECHGKDPKKVKGKLKVLDMASLLDAKRKVVVPKSPDESVLIKRVEATDEDVMPPDPRPKLSAADRKVLRDWVAAGAPAFPDKAAAQTATPAPAPPKPAAAEAAQPKADDVAAQAKAILTKSCFECHGKDPKKPKGKLKILDMASLLDAKRKIVVPKSPDESVLIKRVEATDEDVMPPDPRPRLSDADRKVLRDWVAAGAPAFPEKTADQTPVTPPPTPGQPATPAQPTKVEAGTPTLDEELLKQAPQVLAYLREKEHKNVGVLKFRVQNGPDGPSDNVGPLNQALATRLEMALVLADDDKDPVGIIRDASAVAALIPRANHLKSDGRAPLFGPKYPLAWGDTLVKPEAFVVGGARLSSDLRRMMIQLYGFGKDGDVEKLGEPFIVACDPALLIEAGESFLVPGGLGKEPDALTPAKAIESAVEVRDQKVLSLVLDRRAPVKLEVRYDGKPVPVAYQDGRFSVPEPKEGQKVSFVVRRQAAAGQADQRLGVVLKVNGASTLFRERLAEGQCRKWVLEPGTTELTIDHFQTDDKDDPGELQLQAVAKSKPGEVRYSQDVGTLTLVVFREAAGKEAAPAVPENVAAEGRGAFPAQKAADLAALKEQLHKDAAPENAARGLDAPAKAGDAPHEVEFHADPTPVMALTVTCNHP